MKNPLQLRVLQKDVESLQKIYPQGTERGSIGKEQEEGLLEKKVNFETL
jgi:hypothetical protein